MAKKSAELAHVLRILDGFNGTLDYHFDKKNEQHIHTQNAHPPKIRRGYDVIYPTWEHSINEYRQFSEQIQEIRSKLDVLEENIERHQKLSLNAAQSLNNHKIGTLEGLARDTIRKNGLKPDNFIVQDILEEPYNEMAVRGRNPVLRNDTTVFPRNEEIKGVKVLGGKSLKKRRKKSKSKKRR